MIPVSCYQCGRIIAKKSWLDRLTKESPQQVFKSADLSLCCRVRFVEYFDSE